MQSSIGSVFWSPDREKPSPPAGQIVVWMCHQGGTMHTLRRWARHAAEHGLALLRYRIAVQVKPSTSIRVPLPAWMHRLRTAR